MQVAGVSSLARKAANAKSRKQWAAYADRATGYARDIVSGKILACSWAKLACQRHLDDLARARGKDFPYRFDRVRAGKVCEFIERFPHVKGKWASGNQRIRLEPWQLFIVCSLFGWLYKSTGLRRFWEAIILVPRKNGKTVLAAGIGLYMFVGDGEPGAEVYNGASTLKQAREVFNPATKMAKRADGFKEWFGVTVAKESMYVLEEGSKFEMVIGNPGDGPSPHCFIHDEFHEQPTFAQYETAHTGVMAREQSLQITISTAGFDIESPCYELQENLKRILDGTVPDDHVFGIIYTIDDPDRMVSLPDGSERPYWATLDAVRESNPNFGVSVLAEKIEADLETAFRRANRTNSFKVKNENLWVNARRAWMNMSKWKACGDPSLSLEEFQNDECIEGVDLASKVDLASRCKLFVRMVDRKRHYYAFGRHYVPMDRATDGEHQHYERWLEEGKIVGHKGSEIQLPMIQKEIEEELGRFRFKSIAFDPWSALQMQQDLAAQTENDVVVSIPQTVQYISEPMKEVEAAVLSGRFHHDGDPVLAWAMSCVQVKEDAKENIFPRKELNGIAKIDPATALFNAMNRAMVAQAVSEPGVFFA